MPSIADSPAAGGAPLRVMIDGRAGHMIEAIDRALHYGDGLFETIRLRDGRSCQWSRHLDRLTVGAERLGIPLPPLETLAAESLDLARGLRDGVLKILISRGSGGRGYRPPEPPSPRRILLVYPLPADSGDSWKAGVIVRYCRTPASLNPMLAGVKHLNRLDAVLARREWSDPAIAEGLMLDPVGHVIGGTMTNLFVWDGVRLLTPRVDQCGIAGTRRALTFEQADQAGIACEHARLEPADLVQARGLFLTNAVVGVWPVRELAGHAFDLARLPWDLLETVHRVGQTPG